MWDRHCTFNNLNCYKAPDWACLRIKGDNDIPIHFTVSWIRTVDELFSET